MRLTLKLHKILISNLGSYARYLALNFYHFTTAVVEKQVSVRVQKTIQTVMSEFAYLVNFSTRGSL